MHYPRSALGYCSNVHPGESLAAVNGNLQQYLDAVRNQRDLPRMNSGLWLSHRAASELQASLATIKEFHHQLDQCSIDLITLNGFPFGDFHQQQVKSAVYQPDWSQPARYDYTLELASILASCLPEGVTEGTISTLPLGDAPGWSELHQQQAVEHLLRVSEALAQCYQETGKQIRLCLEMEPGCVLERSDQVINFFVNALEQGRQRLGFPRAWIDAHLGICFDVCHQAVMFEDVAESLSKIVDAGIVVGKVQLSSALHVPSPNTTQAIEALTAFVEPRYLHQVRTLNDAGEVVGASDLIDALEVGLPTVHPWRVHFHLPLQQASIADGVLRTTHDAVGMVLDFIAATPDFRPHLEVETYTWQVLPPAIGVDSDDGLINGIVAELNWVEQQMSTRGLLA